MADSWLHRADPRAKLTELYELRDPLYMQVADLVVATGKQSVHGLVQHLERELKRFLEAGHGNW